MLLPYPCLAPHHPLSGTPSSHVWYPTCIWYAITCIWYTTICIWYTTTCLVPYHPCMVTLFLSGTPPSLSGISPHYLHPPLSRTQSYVWNPIPSPVWYPTLMSHCHHLAHNTPPPSGHCCSYLASNCPLPLVLTPVYLPS